MRVRQLRHGSIEQGRTATFSLPKDKPATLGLLAMGSSGLSVWGRGEESMSAARTVNSADVHRETGPLFICLWFNGRLLQPSFNNAGQLVALEILPFSRPHLGHCGVRLAVVVGGIPEEKADSAHVFCRPHLDFDVLRRVS